MKAKHKGAIPRSICTITVQHPYRAVLLAATRKGISTLLLGESEDRLIEKFKAQYGTDVIMQDVQLRPWVERITAYLQGNHRDLSDLPLDLDSAGTDFQLAVWEELRDIGYGEVRTYGEMANQLNTSARAVGQACANNPILLLIPCHRVVRSNGEPGGYHGGKGERAIEIKRALLDLEGG